MSGKAVDDGRGDQKQDEDDNSEALTPTATAQNEDQLDVQNEALAGSADDDDFVPQLSRKASVGLPSLGSINTMSQQELTVDTNNDEIIDSAAPGESPGLPTSSKPIPGGEYQSDDNAGGGGNGESNNGEDALFSEGVQTIADMSEEVEEMVMPDEGEMSEEYSEELEPLDPPPRFESKAGGSLVAVPEDDSMEEKQFDEDEHEEETRPPRSARSLRPGPDRSQTSNWSVPGMWKQGSSVFFIQWTPESDEDEIDLTLCEVLSKFLISTYRKNEVFILVIAAILLAKAYPPIGAYYVCKEWTASYIAVMFIFVLSGLGLKTEKFSEALKRGSFNLFVQVFSFGVDSGIVFAASRALLKIQNENLINEGLVGGMIVCSCLPMTISSVIVLTKLSGGDEASAVFNSAFGSLLSIVLTPLLVTVYLGNDSEGSTLKRYIDLIIRIVIPLAIGQVLQKKSEWAVQFVANFKPVFQRAQLYAVIFIVYTSFSNNFENGAKSAPSQIFFMVLCQCVFIAIIKILAWTSLGYAFPNEPKLRVMGFYGCSQKSVALGVPMINALFEGDPNSGLYLLPLLVWYPLQLILGSLLTPEIQAFTASEKLRLLIEKDKKRDEAGSEDAVRTEAYLSGTLSIESGSLASIESYNSDEDEESKSYRPGLRRQSMAIFHHDELSEDASSMGALSLGDDTSEGFQQFTLVCYESFAGDMYDEDDDDDDGEGVGGLDEEMGGEIIEEVLNDMEEHEELIFEEPLKDDGGKNRDSMNSRVSAETSGSAGQTHGSFYSEDSPVPPSSGKSLGSPDDGSFLSAADKKSSLTPGMKSSLKKSSLTPSTKSSLTPGLKSSLKKPSSITSASSQPAKKPSSTVSLSPKKPASISSKASRRSKSSLKSKGSLTPSLKSKGSLTPSVKSKDSLTPSEKSERQRRRIERRSKRGSTAIANILADRRGSVYSGSRSRRGSVFSGARSRRGSVFSGARSRRGSVFSGSRRRSTFDHRRSSAGRRQTLVAPCGRSHQFYKLGSVYEKQTEPGLDFLMGTYCAGSCNQPIANDSTEVGKLPSESNPVYNCIRCKTHVICNACWKQKKAPKIEDSIWNLY